MKQNQRRSRSRGNGKRHSGRNYSFESSGPDGKIRGTAQQVYDKYQALGRDALSSGDRIAAEGYFQHAEHYFRIIMADSSRANGNGRNETDAKSKSDDNVTEVPIAENADEAAVQERPSA